MILPIALLLLAYLIGGIPFGYVLVWLKTGKDVRAMGSGNIGATNVLRTTGRGFGVLTLLLDIAKGYLAVWLMLRGTQGDLPWASAAALAVLLGHAFPVYLKFQGGKAVASFVGAFLCLAPAAVGVCALFFVAVVAWSRYISLGSILGAAVFPFIVAIFAYPDWPVIGAALLASALVIWRHRSNIERLRAGKENVFRFGGKKA
ncbi:MAG: glycerol-3-phosphate 1-O-acyltransferase PlsY [Bryobacteraceae bacterium]|nr:glycerol-3-phosphate 1-O-acyltransferase PlsY [Bryobacteraceae bacterium]